MKDLHIDRQSRRTGILPGAGELQRRKELRAGRRTFRAWPLLPVPAPRPAGAPQDGPAVDWPSGHGVFRGDDWQDKPDQRELDKNFAPAPDASLWREANRNAARSWEFSFRLLAAIALHACCAIFLIARPAPDTVEIAGGGAISVMMVGEQAFDSLAAGKTEGESAKPLEEVDAVETAEQPVEATTTQDLVEPAEIQSATSEPVSPATQPAPQVDPTPVAVETPAEQVPETVSERQEAAPATSASAAQNLAIDPKAVSEAGELVPATENAAVEPQPQQQIEPVEAAKPPEPTKLTAKLSAEKKPSTVRKPEKTKTKDKIAARRKAEAERDAKRAAATSSKGEAGEADANAQRGASSSNNSRAPSDAGNAAVSNYPGKVAAKLRRALKYPKSAVSGSRGETRVAFTILADGSAAGVRIVSSSGSPVLDQAAVEAVRRASPFPPIPPEAGKGQWPFAVPVLFQR